MILNFFLIFGSLSRACNIYSMPLEDLLELIFIMNVNMSFKGATVRIYSLTLIIEFSMIQSINSSSIDARQKCPYK
ncbi:hypothetical protein BGW37DRAFT_251547 [Umbelopsis sp. PMI_123]|nr:hypothetical protein BGW37DRAFT_251547 [Umbelopsis sp. PMI_123]